MRKRRICKEKNTSGDKGRDLPAHCFTSPRP
jgi:hypothetical protein